MVRRRPTPPGVAARPGVLSSKLRKSSRNQLCHTHGFQSSLSIRRPSARRAVPPDEIKVQCEGGSAGPWISSSLAPAQPTLTIALPPNPHPFLVPGPPFHSLGSRRFALRRPCRATPHGALLHPNQGAMRWRVGRGSKGSGGS